MTPPRTPVVLARAEQWTSSSADGHAYDVMLAWPDTPAPPQGFPLLVVLDASQSFATVTETMRRHARRPPATGVEPMVILGVSQREAPQAMADARRRDFAGFEWRAFDRWLTALVSEDLAHDLAIDPSRRTLLGHSMAGMAALRHVLSADGAFTRCAAISPSVWAGVDELESAIQRTTSDVLASRRLLLSVGDYEEKLAPWHTGLDAKTSETRRSERQMVSGATRLSDRLKPLIGLEFRLISEADHASALTLSLPAALRLAAL